IKHEISVIRETAVFIGNTLTKTIRIITSREKLSRVWRTPFYQNTCYLMSGTIINSVLGFVFWILAAKLYAAEVVGLGSAIMSALRLLALFAELGWGISLVRYLPSAGKNGNEMINTCFTLSGLTAVISSLIFLSGLTLWTPALLSIRQDPLYLIAFIFFTFSMVLQPLALTVLLARLKTRIIFIINVIAGILGIILVGIFSIFTDDALGIFSAM